MIPKVIHYCWLSEDPLPYLVEKCMGSWKKVLPDYEIKCWTTKNFDINSTPWTKEAFAKKRYAAASDYIRLYALFHEGGIYLDSDVEMLRSFDPYLSCPSFMGWEYSGVLEAAIIGAEKGMPWIKHCMDTFGNTHFLQVCNTPHLFVAPLVIQRALQEISPSFPAKAEDEIHIIKDLNLHLYPYVFFSPKNIHNQKIKKGKDTICIHHFNADWVQKNTFYYMKRELHKLSYWVLGEKVYKKFVSLVRKNKNSN